MPKIGNSFATIEPVMKNLHSNTDGFTVIELLVFIIVLVAVSVLGVSNVRNLRAQNRDSTSKSDINATYYQLEAFYEKNGYYPSTVDATILKGIDPDSLKDRGGAVINQAGSIYTYKPAGCADTKCKSFVLTAQLEKEAPFVKQSLNQ